MINDLILRALYNGELYPSERIVPVDPDYRPLGHRIDSEMEYLAKRLSEEDGKRLAELGNMYRQSSAMDGYASFAYGFKLGGLLICQIAQDSNRL